ncbi:ubiquitin fusion degradation protein, putative [Theileria equi strain WA]|uniref:Ubiquitin fusion degradation protein, putative n=1 Tax=Theileria equi strain WA TaxID=1537102 RepID=L0AWQ2_THEEQ|nr:ubiquitin fusion degradation protein, putative [Theileria equi strain WA]AFZ79441.1 ubiquitin fusion degradation protein, putative [Theileria equi strain WA]|eukprot:XP_004829107.1 ubiquitin fusion degradation protein, putative [Theileria equi strain WA]
MWNWNQFDNIWTNFNNLSSTPLVNNYRCFSVSFAGKESMENGNKILLPQSALNELASRNISWPMMFEIKNPKNGKITHGGVLEFISEEGCCNIPYWVMQNLGLNEGQVVTIRNVSLPKALWVKLKPLTEDYWEISNPRAILETSLRNFATLTAGDIIPIHYINKVYNIEIVELKPGFACSIIETDMEVEFESLPVEPAKAESTQDKRPCSVQLPMGSRIDGKTPKIAKQKTQEQNVTPWNNKLPFGIRTTCEDFERLVRQGRIPAVKRG